MTTSALTALRQAFVQCRDLNASLDERLNTYSQAVRNFIPTYADAVDDLVRRLTQNGAGSNAPRPGEPMPPFILPDETGRLVSLEQMLARGPLAITFHRGHWCPWCRISINALVRDIQRAPFEGIGKPEPLKHGSHAVACHLFDTAPNEAAKETAA